MILADVPDEMHRLSALLDDALGFLKRQTKELADAENAYRKAKAEAWVLCPNDASGTKPADKDWTSAKRESWVNAQTADLRRTRDLADGMRTAALEAIRSRRTQISALQSLLAAHREEAAFARTGPDGIAA